MPGRSPRRCECGVLLTVHCDPCDRPSRSQDRTGSRSEFQSRGAGPSAVRWPVPAVPCFHPRRLGAAPVALSDVLWGRPRACEAMTAGLGVPLVGPAGNSRCPLTPAPASAVCVCASRTVPVTPARSRPGVAVGATRGGCGGRALTPGVGPARSPSWADGSPSPTRDCSRGPLISPAHAGDRARAAALQWRHAVHARIPAPSVSHGHPGSGPQPCGPRDGVLGWGRFRHPHASSPAAAVRPVPGGPPAPARPGGGGSL